jgi:rubrerythrin
MSADRARRQLIALLRLAYSGELAAATAYAGHARAVRRPEERQTIRRIEAEERAHRARVGEMLASLDARARWWRELRMLLTGLAIAALCFLGGWYVPMYGAGRIERANIREYEEAARLALCAGFAAWADELLAMAEVEWDHERYFHDQIRGHPLQRLLPAWASPPPRSEIRASFEAFRRTLPGAEQAAGDGRIVTGG